MSARSKSRSHRKPAKQKDKPPRTAAQYDAMPDKFKNMWESVIEVIRKMRSERTSLRKAAKEEGISPRWVKRLAGSTLQKTSSGRWAAKKSDTLLRILKMATPDGLRAVTIRGSRQATKLAKYSNAVQKYLQTGDTADLSKFQGKSIKDADGVEHLLITDRRQLNRLGSAGVLSFESLYSKSV
jgi:hypothetical protein